MSQPQLLIKMGMEVHAKEEAICMAVDLLAEAGCVPSDYAESMFRREKTANTFLGNGLAIPHGELADKHMVKHNGLAFLQIPKGVDWGNGNTATLVVAIAAASDSHTDILTRLADIVTDEKRLAGLNAAIHADQIRSALTDNGKPVEDEAQEDDLPHSFEWKIDYPAGLHARPATIWVEKAKAANVRLRVRNGARSADPRTLVALLRLGAKAGDTLVVSADGSGAEEALAVFRSDIQALSAGEKLQAVRVAGRSARVSTRAWVPPKADASLAIEGISASPGLAIGTVHRLDPAVLDVPDTPQSLIEAGNRLDDALNRARLQLQAVIDDACRRLGASDAAIFKAQATLLDDNEIIGETCRLVVDGHGIAWSWHHAIERQVAELRSVGNPVMAGRAADLRDVSLRVLTFLEPELEIRKSKLPLGCDIIIVANDLTPSDTAAIDTDKVIGLATVLGGPTSHTAILARTLGLPSVVAAGNDLLAVEEGATIVLDGDGGRVWIDPTPEVLESVRAEMAKRKAERLRQAEFRAHPAQTLDSHRVEVAANINTPDQAALALEMGAESVGLMRTELLFLEKSETPSEDEQFAIFREMADAVTGKSLVVRTLDIGGDKQVPHLNLPAEDNPFLGVRGSRLLLLRMDLFAPQMRALYRAAKECPNIRVMFPMITSVTEVLEIKKFCDWIRRQMDAPEIPLGIMIEVPAAAVMADILARHVDFFSVGTNDLTQYTLAMDRDNPELAAKADGLHPAVLRMIRTTVEGARRHNRHVGVCGGIAGDPVGAAVLAGLGVDELSMTPRDIPAVKDLIRGQTFVRLAELSSKALDMENAGDVHDLLESALL